MMRAVHLSYATANLSQATKLLLKSAGRFGLDSRIYTPEHPVLADLRQKHPSIMAEPRGAGYWLWKPSIILDVLNSVPDGTAVLYTDVAITFVADPAPLMLLTKEHPVCLFKMSGPMLQGTWTKRDCFVEMSADTDEFWSMPQLWAGMQLYRAGPEARRFVSLLAEAMASETRLTDKPNVHGLPNLPDFVEHRHDQSVLTILARQQGAAIFRDPSQCWDSPSAPASETPFDQTVFLHRTRNQPLHKWLSKRLRRKYTGGRGFL
ncbi:hypothetical protein LGH82_07440 [Mesorhizobium sp. PAMC28654]|uniref:hypothetical protein n=1 Tax=Mesorhizobium sp. PAMC28654 TaxID=2880934 RepID=UPI001D0BD14C|nr:hypothetical protein [Mesorhizobium sp. PAMC28654]UDL91097.1 hypothetical protein LGH82_07440 [Mesorhizobium sp. PAMC28654]